jgi:hypothetical protein
LSPTTLDHQSRLVAPADRIIKRGTNGWLILAVYVILWDNLAHARRGQTLSDAFWRGLTSTHRHRRVIVLACWAIVTSHLLFRTPLPIILPRMFPELKEVIEELVES